MDSFSYGSPYLDSLAKKYNYVKILHETFDNVIVPEFKERGFRKNGNTFYRQRDGLIEVCNVQFSRDNTPINASFTYNIKISIPSLYDSMNIKYPNKREAIIYNNRFGSIINWASNGKFGFSDYWYKLNLWNFKSSINFQKEIASGEESYIFLEKLQNKYNFQTAEGFHEVITDDIENIIIKFFNSIPSAEILLYNIDNNKPNGCIEETMMYNVAVLYHKNGEEEKTRKIFKKIQNGCCQKRIESFAKSAGIIL